jgi:hypothetical protein
MHDLQKFGMHWLIRKVAIHQFISYYVCGIVGIIEGDGLYEFTQNWLVFLKHVPDGKLL